MNDGISIDEACRLSPQGLTTEQAQNCPGQQSSVPPYLFLGIGGAVLAIALIVFIVVKFKRSK
jgi:hypothetical protein